MIQQATIVRVGESLEREFGKPESPDGKPVQTFFSIDCPAVVRAEMRDDGTGARFTAESEGFCSYRVEFRTSDGALISSAGEQFTVLPPGTKLVRAPAKKKPARAERPKRKKARRAGTR